MVKKPTQSRIIKPIENNQKPTKTGKLKGKFIHFLKLLTDEQYLTDMTYGRLSKKIINAIKILIASYRKFFNDDCFTKASSIAYTILISLIPTLTVSLVFYSFFKSVGDPKVEIIKYINQFVAENNLQKLDIGPILDAISALIDNAAQVSIIGSIVLIFTATAILRTLEKSLNDIWLVKRQRPFFIKMIYYWATLTLGPIIILAGPTLASQVSTFFTAPTYTSIAFDSNNTIWLTGTKGTINYGSKENINKNKLKSISMSQIDFDNQKTYEYDQEKHAINKSGITIAANDLTDAEYSDIQLLRNKIWIVSRDGIILSSNDNGLNWKIDRFRNLKFNDIHMLSAETGYIAADNGHLLKTVDGGESWQPIYWPGITANLKSIYIDNTKAFIVASDGYLFTYNPETKEWIPRLLKQARISRTYMDLNSINFKGNNGWITCENGIILKTTNGGKRWKAQQFRQYDYKTSYFYSRNKGYISGEKGTLLYTEDHGKSWRVSKLSTNYVNNLKFYNKELWAVGNFGMVMYLDEFNIWQGIKGKNRFVYFFNFFGPFIFIWLLFLLMYLVLPNRKIPFRPAAIGASLTSAIWVGFVLLFIFYIKSFNSTFMIYGALSAIPLFLLLIYASSLITLFGAEVSYTIMHPETYRKLNKKSRKRNATYVYNCIKIIYTIYKRFEKGKGATEFKKVLKVNSDRFEETNNFIDLLLKHNYITKNENSEFMPATRSDKIIIADLIDILHDANLELPPSQTSDSLRRDLGQLFKEMSESRKNILKKVTLDNLINES